jgi:hypothetical protein
MATIARGRGIVSVALCALAAHAVLYGSFSPGGAMHGYFGWYEPLVAGLTGLAVLAVGALVLAAALGHGRSRLRAVLPAPSATPGLQAARLAQAALISLFLQETFERSLALGHPAVPSFAPSTWLLVLVSLVAFAALLVLAGRLGTRIVSLVLGSPRRRLRSLALASPPRLRIAPQRRNPLAERRGLRAPPLLAG